MTIHQLKNKPNVIYSYHGLLLNQKKEMKSYTWVGIENMLSERHQTKSTYCYLSRTDKSVDKRHKAGSCPGLGEDGVGC
jgi:hypothetical protein